MAVITLSGEAGCRVEEVARLAAGRLSFQLVTESAVHRLMEEEFGAAAGVPEKLYRYALAMLLARLATEQHLVVSAPGAELVEDFLPGTLRVCLVAPVNARVGTLMLDHRLERPAAREMLKAKEREYRCWRRAEFGRASLTPQTFDVVLNAGRSDSEQMAGFIAHLAEARQLPSSGLLPTSTQVWHEFQMLLRLAKHGISPAGRAGLPHRPFSHPSEEIFANLLDFYRVAWEFEPRSFPICWDESGKPVEYFTPDFFLPEFDLYLELTTMKQSLVTRKNRKVKLLRSLYPEINIQVFYQKDFQNLIFKYGLADRLLRA